MAIESIGFQNSSNNRIFYVSPDGSDSASGTAENSWRTIQHAVDMLSAGDKIVIRGGVYNEQVYITNDGDTWSDYITITAYPGEKPVIVGGGLTTEENGVVIAASRVRLMDLEIANWEGNGVWIEGSHHVEISNCTVRNVGYGIGVADGSHDFVFTNVDVHNFQLYGFDVSPSGGDDCYNGVFINCVAHSGSDQEQNVDGFALGHGDQWGFYFKRCITYGVYDGFDISARDTLLEGCLAYGCSNSGYKIWEENVTLANCIGYDSTTNLELDWKGTAKSVNIMNCDFISSEIFNIWVENSMDSLFLYNSILVGGENIGIAFEKGWAENYRGDFNLFHNLDPDRMITLSYEKEFSIESVSEGGWTEYIGQDGNTQVISDPEDLFMDLAKRVLYLKEGSLAIDAGGDEYPVLIDFEGAERPFGDGIDIGAFEYPNGRVDKTYIEYLSKRTLLQENTTDSDDANSAIRNNSNKKSFDWDQNGIVWMILWFLPLVIFVAILLRARRGSGDPT